MDAQRITKTVIRFLVRSGVSAAAGNIVANNRNTSDTEIVDTYHKTAAFAGGAALGWYVSEPVSNFAGDKVDETFALVRTWLAKN